MGVRLDPPRDPDERPRTTALGHAGLGTATPPAAMPAALPVGIIVAALLAMLLIPVVSTQRTAGLREDLRTVAEPARGEITRLHLALATSESALRDYLESGDPAFLAAYHQERAQARDAMTRLEALSARLGSDVDGRLDSVRALGDRWETSSSALLAHPRPTVALPASDRGLAPAIPPAEVGANGARETWRRDSLQSDAYTATLVAAARLDEAVAREARRHRARIEAAERASAWLTLALGVLALAGAGAAGWLGHSLRRYALEAERRRREAEHAMESKAQLMRGLSHDLKNPLNAIDGHAQLLGDEIRGPLSSGQRESVERIRRAVRSLLGLIGDLLDLAAAESRALRVEHRPTDVTALVRELTEEYRAAAETAGLHLSVGDDDGVGTVATDAARVRQVVGNLVSNAIKYTPAGGHVSVWTGRSPAALGAGAARRVRIAVSDTGPGIPPDARDRVFDEFVRLHTATTPGAGLGLAISRHIARALGGDVRLEPAAGPGATFVLELPLERRTDDRRRG